MALTLKHNTGDYEIETSNCEELKAVIGPEAKYLKKHELVARVISLRDELKAAFDRAEADKEARRLERVAAEKANPNVVAAHLAIVDVIDSEMDSCRKTIKKFQAKIAEADTNTNSIPYEIEWHADDVFLAYETLSELSGLYNFFNAQAVDQTFTCQQIQDGLDEQFKRASRDMFRVSTSQSTSPVANVRAMMALKAKGIKASMLENLSNHYVKMVSGDSHLACYIFHCF